MTSSLTPTPLPSHSQVVVLEAKIKEDAISIYRQYLARDAPLELSVDHDYREALHDLFSTGRHDILV